MSGKFESKNQTLRMNLPMIHTIIRAVQTEGLGGINVGDGRRCLFKVQLGKNAARIDGIGIVGLEMDDRLPLINDFRSSVSTAEDVEEIVQHSGAGVMHCRLLLLAVIHNPQFPKIDVLPVVFRRRRCSVCRCGGGFNFVIRWSQPVIRRIRVADERRNQTVDVVRSAGLIQFLRVRIQQGADGFSRSAENARMQITRSVFQEADFFRRWERD